MPDHGERAGKRKEIMSAKGGHAPAGKNGRAAHGAAAGAGGRCILQLIFRILPAV